MYTLAQHQHRILWNVLTKEWRSLVGRLKKTKNVKLSTIALLKKKKFQATCLQKKQLLFFPLKEKVCPVYDCASNYLEVVVRCVGDCANCPGTAHYYMWGPVVPHPPMATHTHTYTHTPAHSETHRGSEILHSPFPSLHSTQPTSRIAWSRGASWDTRRRQRSFSSSDPFLKMSSILEITSPSVILLGGGKLWMGEWENGRERKGAFLK